MSPRRKAARVTTSRKRSVLKRSTKRQKTEKARTPSPPVKLSKQTQILTMLRQPAGVSVAAIASAIGWQQHSVRGFFAAVVKKRLGFDLIRFSGQDGQHLYRIELLSAPSKEDKSDS